MFKSSNIEQAIEELNTLAKEECEKTRIAFSKLSAKGLLSSHSNAWLGLVQQADKFSVPRTCDTRLKIELVKAIRNYIATTLGRSKLEFSNSPACIAGDMFSDQDSAVVKAYNLCSLNDGEALTHVMQDVAIIGRIIDDEFNENLKYHTNKKMIEGMSRASRREEIVSRGKTDHLSTVPKPNGPLEL